MQGFRTRACGPQDAAAIAELVNLADRADGLRGEYAVAEFEELLRHEVRDLGTDTLAALDGDGRLAGVGIVPLAQGDRVELIGAVHPQRRGLGIGRAVLAWQLRVAAGHRAQVIAAVGDRPSIRLYARFGFHVVRYFVEMSAPIGDPPAQPGPEGLRVVPFDTTQAFELYRVHAAAFAELWGHQERSFPEWKALTVESEQFRGDLARLALDGDAIAGFVLPYDRGTLYIGQVGTAPDRRRRGIATALLTEVLAAAGAQGFTVATLTMDAANPTGAPSVYARAGFAVDRQVAAYQCTAADSRL
ncbi:GNAT family N-acetyltransferase [Dactylosporangium vinaceum]|uniref:GNAT family N-acetyltransferase n=1 Tax=Dactylosporangium vinaceum TaxID=53362 RepID=A0ABV5MA77_9ACTN|nr:GNAT family N-acetyltransferase [Dactylosporangium vinaceum]UAB93056.1 GNAT family N-acetyltransferase [Dactylosporangium vinaceum]